MPSLMPSADSPVPQASPLFHMSKLTLRSKDTAKHNNLRIQNRQSPRQRSLS